MSRPIADYALLGDCHSAALVATDGCIEWWCPERFDSRSVFARILDPDAGHFAIRPTGHFETTRAYDPDTMVLRTTFTTPTGSVRLTDALVFEHGAREHEIGLRSPHVLARVVEAVAGQVELEVEFAPRPEYGLVQPALRRIPAGVLTVGGADTLLLATEIALDLDGATARGTLCCRRASRRPSLCTIAPGWRRPTSARSTRRARSRTRSRAGVPGSTRTSATTASITRRSTAARWSCRP